MLFLLGYTEYIKYLLKVKVTPEMIYVFLPTTKLNSELSLSPLFKLLKGILYKIQIERRHFEGH